MPDEITPHAQPIAPAGDPAWFPPEEDDAEARLRTGERPSTLRHIFYGKDGLRAGWSILLFLLIAFAFGAVINQVARRLHPGKGPHVTEQTASSILVAEALSFATIGIAALIVSRVEKRRFSAYGIGSVRLRLGQFLVGSLWGVTLLSLLVVILRARGLLVFSGKLLSGFDILRWGATWALGFLLVGLLEEFLTRGFLQFTVARGLAGIAEALGMGDRSRKVLGFWLAALFFSFIFGFGHKDNPGESPVGVLSAGLIGLVFAFSLWRTGSLWYAIGWHAAWDWAQSFVYGVADSGMMVQHHLMASHPLGSPLMSGGLTGPEGSIYILGIVTLTAILIALTLPSQPGSPSDPTYSPNEFNG